MPNRNKRNIFGSNVAYFDINPRLHIEIYIFLTEEIRVEYRTGEFVTEKSSRSPKSQPSMLLFMLLF